eukprot:TRINITY_DN10273_c1_g1_i1.p1 TRINITY_DN10273_c1_g1~~TRINITY_DN10273_c1_g1_i1.p1  ORF type:complete len:867 (-),score=125.30 TRINITY_DN10273_c1_g1_i1:82-2682(-)
MYTALQKFCVAASQLQATAQAVAAECVEEETAEAEAAKKKKRQRPVDTAPAPGAPAVVDREQGLLARAPAVMSREEYLSLGKALGYESEAKRPRRAAWPLPGGGDYHDVPFSAWVPRPDDDPVLGEIRRYAAEFRNALHNGFGYGLPVVAFAGESGRGKSYAAFYETFRALQEVLPAETHTLYRQHIILDGSKKRSWEKSIPSEPSEEWLQGRLDAAKELLVSHLQGSGSVPGMKLAEVLEAIVQTAQLPPQQTVCIMVLFDEWPERPQLAKGIAYVASEWNYSQRVHSRKVVLIPVYAGLAQWEWLLSEPGTIALAASRKLMCTFTVREVYVRDTPQACITNGLKELLNKRKDCDPGRVDIVTGTNDVGVLQVVDLAGRNARLTALILKELCCHAGLCDALIKTGHAPRSLLCHVVDSVMSQLRHCSMRPLFETRNQMTHNPSKERSKAWEKVKNQFFALMQYGISGWPVLLDDKLDGGTVKQAVASGLCQCIPVGTPQQELHTIELNYFYALAANELTDTPFPKLAVTYSATPTPTEFAALGTQVLIPARVNSAVLRETSDEVLVADIFRGFLVSHDLVKQAVRLPKGGSCLPSAFTIYDTLPTLATKVTTNTGQQLGLFDPEASFVALTGGRTADKDSFADGIVKHKSLVILVQSEMWCMPTARQGVASAAFEDVYSTMARLVDKQTRSHSVQYEHAKAGMDNDASTQAAAMVRKWTETGHVVVFAYMTSKPLLEFHKVAWNTERGLPGGLPSRTVLMCNENYLRCARAFAFLHYIPFHRITIGQSNPAAVQTGLQALLSDQYKTQAVSQKLAEIAKVAAAVRSLEQLQVQLVQLGIRNCSVKKLLNAFAGPWRQNPNPSHPP